MTSCRLKTLIDNETEFTAEVEGVLDERSQSTFDQLKEVTSQTVTLDFNRLQFISSIGTRILAQTFSHLTASKSRKITLKNCPPSLVEQFNLLPNLVKGLSVDSFQLPYECKSCSHSWLTTVSVGSIDVDQIHEYEEVKCPSCGSEALLEYDAEDYFDFLRVIHEQAS